MAVARELILCPPKKRDLVTLSLSSFREERIKAILGNERLEQIQLNNFPLYLVIDFCLGKVGKKKNGILANLIGFELNAHVVRVLRNLEGVTKIEPEVDIRTPLGNSSIDCVASLDGRQSFTRILPSLKEELYNATPGTNTYENKATRKLGEKAIIQVKKAKTIYPNSNNVIVCADTKVHIEIVKRLDNEGANVLRSVLSKNDLVTSILLMQKQIKSLY